MRLTHLILIAAMGALTGCGELTGTAALFKDVSRYPPKPLPATANAIKADAAFAGWVIYQAETCREHGCKE
jgi:hypothetical protein